MLTKEYLEEILMTHDVVSIAQVAKIIQVPNRQLSRIINADFELKELYEIAKKDTRVQKYRDEIAQNPGISQADLAKKLGVSQQAVSTTLNTSPHLMTFYQETNRAHQRELARKQKIAAAPQRKNQEVVESLARYMFDMANSISPFAAQGALNLATTYELRPKPGRGEISWLPLFGIYFDTLLAMERQESLPTQTELANKWGLRQPQVSVYLIKADFRRQEFTPRSR